MVAPIECCYFLAGSQRKSLRHLLRPCHTSGTSLPFFLQVGTNVILTLGYFTPCHLGHGTLLFRVAPRASRRSAYPYCLTLTPRDWVSYVRFRTFRSACCRPRWLMPRTKIRVVGYTAACLGQGFAIVTLILLLAGDLLLFASAPTVTAYARGVLRYPPSLPF